MRPKKLSIGVDIGGTHITCAAVNLAEGRLLEETFSRESFSHEDAAQAILRSWATALNHTLIKVLESQIAGIGFAIPGPFEYRNGISRMEHKFKHLNGLHIPTSLHPLLLEDKELPMRFLNDATAFAVGEAWQGAGKGYRRVVVITLGTGFGSAFLRDSIPAVSGSDVPPEGCLWHLPFQDGIADDYFSTKWFVREYRKLTGIDLPGVKELMVQTKEDQTAKDLFYRFGQNLADCIGPWLLRFNAEILIVGGNIAHALPYILPGFEASARPQGLNIPVNMSVLLEQAALIGSARLMDNTFWEKAAAELPNI